jgi:hypothetical protein
MDQLPEKPTALSGDRQRGFSRLAALPWFALAKLIGGLYILLTLAVLAAELPGEFDDLYNGMTSIRLSGLFGFGRFFWAGYVTFTQYATILVALSTGLFVYLRQVLPRNSRDWTALLASVSLVLLTLLPLGEPEFVHYPLSRFEQLLVGTYGFLSIQLIFLLLNLLFIFPDGRFVPRWMHWLALETNLVWIALFLTGYAISDLMYGVFLINTVIAILAAFIAQVYRYRKVSNPLQRQQTKWVILSLGMIPLLFVVLIISVILSDYIPPKLDAFGLATAQFMIAVLIPLSIGLSILRHRLWDIDLIIRRTLIYGALTLSLGGIYFLSIVLSESLLSALTGNRSPLAVVLSTLVIAALFTPLRVGIQKAIDRRYYRRKYDAEKILDQFAAVARDEVDLEQISAQLQFAVDRTMQPEMMVLWLKEHEPAPYDPA